MNKKVFIFFVLFSLTFSAFAQNVKYICCNYNVRVRKSDDINSEAIGKIPPLSKVIVLEWTNTYHDINGLGSVWVKVKYGNLEGYVLECFLDDDYDQAREKLAIEGIYKGYKVVNTKNLNGSEVQEIQNCEVTIEFLGFNQFAVTYNSAVLDRGFNTKNDEFPMVLVNLSLKEKFCDRSAWKGTGGILSYFEFSEKELVKIYKEEWEEDSDVVFELHLKKVALP